MTLFTWYIIEETPWPSEPISSFGTDTYLHKRIICDVERNYKLYRSVLIKVHHQIRSAADWMGNFSANVYLRQFSLIHVLMTCNMYMVMFHWSDCDRLWKWPLYDCHPWQNGHLPRDRHQPGWLPLHSHICKFMFHCDYKHSRMWCGHQKWSLKCVV